ncbi:MAG: CRISPR-associated protein Csn1, partial [Prevotella sp.]|nr:CRISPR-associated protein Csn1 [Prevotella sp.]
MIELYPRQRPNDDGIYQLGSPRISSIKNPMAMHSLFRLRKVVNLLLKEGKINPETKIHIEFSRDLNDANRRWAIQTWERDNEKERERCRKKIEEHIANPSDRDIMKYQLWEEQNHKCLYTGKEICITDFLGDNPKYDIEHTIPRSAGGDSTKMNLTLCSSKYNRDVKKTKLPAQLAEHDEILERIKEWKEKYEDLDKSIRKLKGSHGATKEEKDKIIRRRHLLSLQRDYWRGKYLRFTMTEVPEGFSRRQSVDISVISRYARMYLKSVFKHVYIVKGIATSDFRKMWGIQEEYTKKVRDNHVHHCIDAVTIACIDKAEYDKLAQFYHQSDEYKLGTGEKPVFEKPWPSFVDDLKQIQDELFIAHYSKDNMPKQAKRYIRNSNGTKINLTQGDTARASLHNDTYYGAIEVDGKVKYVVRRNLDGLEEKNVKDIVDGEVRSKVENAILLHGSLKKALEHTIWMNEEKQIPIRKVRVFANSITRPINIRQQRDQSRHEYKRQFHVQNDRNYMMAIYVGQDKKGKEKREFELINNITAANFYRRSNDKIPTDHQLVPLHSKSGYPLRYKLKIGTMVLLYETGSEEVWDLDRKNLQKRLYKVTGMSSIVLQEKYDYGTIELVHHQDARPSSEIKKKSGEFKSDEEFRSGIKMYHTQFKALVQGVDFEINDLGEIRRLI